MRAQGWFGDPRLRHDERWFSDGVPTALVRDADRESNDRPPKDTPWLVSALAPEAAYRVDQSEPSGAGRAETPHDPDEVIVGQNAAEMLAGRPTMNMVRFPVSAWRFPLTGFGVAIAFLLW